MEKSVNQRINEELVDHLDGAMRYISYALTQLEADGNYTEEATKLWRIYQSLVSFRAKYEFLNRLGVWQFLQNNTTV